MSKRKSVLVVLNSLELGGTQINAVDFACGVRRLGFDSVLAAREETRFGPGQEPMIGVAAERGVALHIVRGARTTRAYTGRLRDIAEACSACVVHAVGEASLRDAFLGPAAWGTRRFVMTVYEMQVSRLVYRYPDLIVGTANMFEDLSRRRPNVHFISPPVDLERDSCERVEATAFLRESGVREDIPRVVIVSRLSEDMKAHGVEAVLDAAAMLPEGAAQLVIVGTGDAEARLRALGDRINAASTVRRVFFVGAMSDPRPAYAAADIVVGMGGSAARALSFGKPLIAVGERGWSETFAPATAERLFRDSFWSPAHQAGAARRVEVHLRTLLGSHEARAHLGAYGRAFAASRFGLSTMSEKLALVYEAALRRSPRPDRWLEEAIRHEIPKAVAWAGRRRGSIHWLKQAR